MKIRIRYFASLREITEKNEEEVTIHEGATVSDVRILLLKRFSRLQAVLDRAIPAINRDYVTTETRLHDGDEVTFIPPVGGGMEENYLPEPLIARAV